MAIPTGIGPLIVGPGRVEGHVPADVGWGNEFGSRQQSPSPSRNQAHNEAELTESG